MFFNNLFFLKSMTNQIVFQVRHLEDQETVLSLSQVEFTSKNKLLSIFIRLQFVCRPIILEWRPDDLYLSTLINCVTSHHS